MCRTTVAMAFLLLISALSGSATENNVPGDYPAIREEIHCEAENDMELSDYEEFGEPLLVKDPGTPIKPDDPIITMGDCSDYVDLTGLLLPIEAAGTTIGASNDYGPFSERPPCWLLSYGDWDTEISAGPDVAYKWTAPADGDYTISLCESDFDVGLLLYRFTCPEEPVFPDDYICGTDDTCELGAKARYIHLSVGEEILIVADGYGNNSGDFVLRIYETLISDMDWFIETQMETFHVPGVSACIVKDGEIDWTGSYGYAIIEDNIEVADTTLFMLASISKTVTGNAVTQLWEDGLFDLDDDINIYLPFSVRNPSFPTMPITFRMLMTHTSSINDFWPTLNAVRTWGDDPEIPLDQFMEGYLIPGGTYYDSGNYNAWAPGTTYDYSNVGVALTAYLLEEISPDYDSFAQYCSENYFDPLGMDETSWYLADLNLDNLAMPYDWNGSQYVPIGHYSDPWFPSASLKTSSMQLARHLIAFMQYGQIDDIRILDSTTVDMMRKVQNPDVNPYYGLYWRWTYYGLRPVWGHGGSYYGVITRMYFYPEENTGVVVLTNRRSAYAANVIMNHLFEYNAGPSGIIAGIVTDQDSNPIDNVYAKLVGVTRHDYSDPDGEYYVSGLITGDWYDVRFTHPDYVELTVEDISVALGETTYVNVVMQASCDYVIGDFNGSGVFNVADIVDGYSKLKTGLPQPDYTCECPYGGGNEWAVAMDVNNSCTFNVADIVDGYSELKTGSPELEPCEECPPQD